jgi:hypothetical protein
MMASSSRNSAPSSWNSFLDEQPVVRPLCDYVDLLHFLSERHDLSAPPHLVTWWQNWQRRQQQPLQRWEQKAKFEISRCQTAGMHFAIRAVAAQTAALAATALSRPRAMAYTR